jgi:hypothetical protein
VCVCVSLCVCVCVSLCVCVCVSPYATYYNLLLLRIGMKTGDTAREETAAWGEILQLCGRLVDLQMARGTTSPATHSPRSGLDGHCHNGFHACRRCTIARACDDCRPCDDVRHSGLTQDHCTAACILVPLAERPVPPPSSHRRPTLVARPPSSRRRPTPVAPRLPAPRRHTVYQVGGGKCSHYNGCVYYRLAIANRSKITPYLANESCPYRACTQLACKPLE